MDMESILDRVTRRQTKRIVGERPLLESKQFTKKEAEQALRDLGVSDPKVEPGASGVVPRESPAGPKKIRSAKTYEVTRPVYEIKANTPIRSFYRKAQRNILGEKGYSSPLSKSCESCSSGSILIPCFDALRIRCHWQQKTKDPEILGDLLPDAVSEPTIHVCPWDAHIEGNAEVGLNNKGEPGEKCKKRVHEEKWKCEVIEGTADMFENASELIANSTELGERFLDRVNHSLSEVVPGDSVSASASFRTEGALDFLKSLFQLFTTGTIDVDGGIDWTVHYEWPKGEKQTKQFHTDYEIALPVRGDIHWAW